MDAYVLIIDYGSRYGATNQGVRGMGLVKGGLLAQRVGLHALYRVVVVSGRDQKVIGQASARSLGGGEASAFLDGPSREVGAALWSDALSSMPEATQEQVRVGLRDLIVRSLPQTLREAGLLQ